MPGIEAAALAVKLTGGLGRLLKRESCTGAWAQQSDNSGRCPQQSRHHQLSTGDVRRHRLAEEQGDAGCRDTKPGNPDNLFQHCIAQRESGGHPDCVQGDRRADEP